MWREKERIKCSKGVLPLESSKSVSNDGEREKGKVLESKGGSKKKEKQNSDSVLQNRKKHSKKR